MYQDPSLHLRTIERAQQEHRTIAEQHRLARSAQPARRGTAADTTGTAADTTGTAADTTDTAGPARTSPITRMSRISRVRFWAAAPRAASPRV